MEKVKSECQSHSESSLTMSYKGRDGGTNRGGGDILNVESHRRKEEKTDGYGIPRMQSVSTWCSVSQVIISTYLCRKGYCIYLAVNKPRLVRKKIHSRSCLQ